VWNCFYLTASPGLFSMTTHPAQRPVLRRPAPKYYIYIALPTLLLPPLQPNTSRSSLHTDSTC
jgi:hypothetical protein